MSDFVVIDGTVTSTEVEVPPPAGDFLTLDSEPPTTEVATTGPGDFIILDVAASPTVLISDEEGQDFLILTSSGPRGLQGDPGEDSVVPGPPGPAGPAGGTYTHTQSTPSASWLVQHNLNRYVAVDVYVGGEIGLADVTVIDADTLVITFPDAVSGIAAVR